MLVFVDTPNMILIADRLKEIVAGFYGVKSGSEDDSQVQSYIILKSSYIIIMMRISIELLLPVSPKGI